MDSGFRTSLCKDSTIADIISDLQYQVKSGAARASGGDEP